MIARPHSNLTLPVVLTTTRLCLPLGFVTVTVAEGATLPRGWNSGLLFAAIVNPAAMVWSSSGIQGGCSHSTMNVTGDVARSRQSSLREIDRIRAV